MQCPYCGNEDTKIIDSRSMERKNAGGASAENAGDVLLPLK